MWILDASVAIKWFFTDEPGRDQALLVLQELTENPDEFLVPAFFFYEISAVLTRRSKFDKKMVKESLTALYQMGIATVDLGEELTQKALDIACKYKISFYDAIYVALARMMKCTWLTADQKALNRLPKKVGRSLSKY